MAGSIDTPVRLFESESNLGQFSKKIWFYQEVESTNDVLAQLAEDGAPHGTVVVANAQTAGRGRHGNSWYSPAGTGLYLSALVRTTSSPVLTLAAGVAVAEALRKVTSLDATLKWPNDVMVVSTGQPRKVAGILTEASTEQNIVDRVIVGIGINVGEAIWPVGLTGLAGSVEGLTGQTVDRELLLLELLVSFSSLCAEVESGRVGNLLARWQTLAPSCRGTVVEWSVGAVRRRGITEGVDTDGALLVRIGSSLERLVGGEIQHIR
ncbi:MAG: biotin--[acetyl-CoA-carboxylase] ligase [Acidobacteria bacterium]|nr:biotin--[acetyl-CoA-carboxylase] ligase [Acidobacteriota bacterium]|tara:strand:- start:17531 stop:18325 length:795 start_codon:yes stop_codon:yes gene_type:complete